MGRQVTENDGTARAAWRQLDHVHVLVALLLANPDLLVGDLLKNTKASQTFRLYAAPDVRVEKTDSG